MQTQYIHRWSVIAALLTVLTPASVALAQEAQEAQNPMRFDFGKGPAAPEFVQVTPETTYSPERGYGFEGKPSLRSMDGGDDPLMGDAIAGEEPFFFSVRLPEGAYNITVTLGAPGLESQMAVQAESRRLMLKDVAVPADQPAKRTFTVRTFTTALPAEGEMRLTPREVGILNYDDKLTLEFNGRDPAVRSLEIVPAPQATTVFLAGDSTVTDQPDEPWSAWGAMLPRFFEPGVAVANYASSGRALRSFRAERRLDKILGTMKPGDYVFIQFGHNDQKETGEGIGAFTSYKSDLKQYVEAILEKGGHPVLVTSTVRRRFDEDGKWYETLGDYPEAVRQVAREEDVPLIDLHDMSRQIVEALGPETSKAVYVHFPAGTFPGQDEPLKDDTHFSTYGADLLARAVVMGIRENVPDLAEHLRDDLPGIDPASPEPPESWSLPQSPPWRDAVMPEGR